MNEGPTQEPGEGSETSEGPEMNAVVETSAASAVSGSVKGALFGSPNDARSARSASGMTIDDASVDDASEDGEDGEDDGSSVEVPPEAPPASSVDIPAPRLLDESGSGAKGSKSVRIDGLGLTAMIVFVLIGGLLVFGLAQVLLPAAEAQLGAACRPMAPELREGPVPALELEDLDGQPVSLEDFRGKFMILNFWATWCEPCTREWPDLDILAERFAERDDVVVVAIGVDEDRAELLPYLERMGLEDTNVRVLWSKDPESYKTLGSEKIPDTYFVDSEGQLVSVFVNVRAWGKAQAVRCVNSHAD